jgi:hypothetical protein
MIDSSVAAIAKVDAVSHGKRGPRRGPREDAHQRQQPDHGDRAQAEEDPQVARAELPVHV